MGRWVLLLHELPDRSWHYDWMIQPRPGAALIAFRLTRRPDDGTLTDFPAERLADHRPAYLDFEGEVSGGRGAVRRVASGAAEVLRDDAVFVVELDPGRAWVGERAAFESPHYQFRLSNGPWIGHTDGPPAGR